MVPLIVDRKVTLIILLILCSMLVALPNTEIVRATEDSWSTLEPMPTARSGLGVAVVDGKIYAIVSGINPTYQPMEVLHQLDITKPKMLIVLDALYDSSIKPIIQESSIEIVMILSKINSSAR